MVKIRTTVTMRKFNITLSEREMSALADMLNWNETTIADHYNMCNYEDYGNEKDLTKELITLRDKFRNALNDED